MGAAFKCDMCKALQVGETSPTWTSNMARDLLKIEVRINFISTEDRRYLDLCTSCMDSLMEVVASGGLSIPNKEEDGNYSKIGQTRKR